MQCAAVVKVQELEGFVGRCDGDGSDGAGEPGKDARCVCGGDGAVWVRGSQDAGASYDICTGASHVEVGVDKTVVGAERDVAQSLNVVILVRWVNDLIALMMRGEGLVVIAPGKVSITHCGILDNCGGMNCQCY